jgi:hypothetical protein
MLIEPSDFVRCPSCGSTELPAIKVPGHMSMGIGFQAGLLITDVDGRAVGFTESERQGRAASAQDHGDGSVSITLTGTSPQNEDDTVPACSILVRAMNQQGETWNQPSAVEESADDADCTATNVDAAIAPLRIQVVRAIVDQEVWRDLEQSGKLSKPNVAVEKLADFLVAALNKKIGRIPLKQRKGLVLALDANRLPGLTFDVVVDCFRERHGGGLAEAGFQSVWIVGPTEWLTKRLD